MPLVAERVVPSLPPRGLDGHAVEAKRWRPERVSVVDWLTRRHVLAPSREPSMAKSLEAAVQVPKPNRRER